MARDVSIRLDRCQYCNRPGFVVWDADLFTCGREVCKSLAFAEVRRRHHDDRRAPERRLARALLTAFDTLDYTVHLDEQGEVLTPKEADAISGREREQTAHLLAELHALARRYPPLDTDEVETKPVRPPSPRYRRFVARGRTVPLHNAA